MNKEGGISVDFVVDRIIGDLLVEIVDEGFVSNSVDEEIADVVNIEDGYVVVVEFNIVGDSFELAVENLVLVELVNDA